MALSTRARWLPSSPLLPWSPPTLTSPKTVFVDDTSPNRFIALNPGQDCNIIMPSTPVTDPTPVGFNDALVTVSGGRHVTVIGGHIQAQVTPVAHLTAPVADGTVTTFQVDSTAGFPPTGLLRVDGELMNYSSIDATHFYISIRNSGFFNSGPTSSQTTHAAGSVVYLGENARSGISFMNQTGTVHVEGLLIDGFVNDGLRVSGGLSTLQVQRCRVGPNTNFDLQYETDGHPDCTQAYGSGAAEIRMAQVTFLCGANGNGILNNGTNNSDGTHTAVPIWRFWDSELIDAEGTARTLVANVDTSTAWEVRNGWMRGARARSALVSDGSNTLDAKLSWATLLPGQPDIVPATTVGRGYVSPGYAA